MTPVKISAVIKVLKSSQEVIESRAFGAWDRSCGISESVEQVLYLLELLRGPSPLRHLVRHLRPMNITGANGRPACWAGTHSLD